MNTQEKMSSMKTVFFGQYPQNGSFPEPLEWLVLDESEQEMLLLCKYCIETKGFVFDFNDDQYEYRKSLWEFSDLRQWLNNEFYSVAFDEGQKEMVLTTEIKTLDHMVSCADTADTVENSSDICENKVFLLSKEQADQYLTTQKLRKGIRTVHAANSPDVLVSDRNKIENIPWWILPHVESGGVSSVNHGKDKNKRFSYVSYPQVVLDKGTQYHGRNVCHRDWSVRPAIRIRKKNIEQRLKIEIIQGDLLEVECDAIVNLQAVVPKWLDGQHGEWEALEQCCRDIVFKSGENADIGVLAVLLPGTGSNGFPMITSHVGYEGAAFSILKSLNRSLYEQPLGRTIHTIKIVCSNTHQYEQMQEAANKMFGSGLAVRDRIRGSLLGGAVGDAFGYPVEFTKGYDAFHAKYPENEKKALISDDTQMTLFTACGILYGDTRCALKTGGSNSGQVYSRYLSMAYQDWYQTQCPDSQNKQASVSWIRYIPAMNARRAPGITCMEALRSNHYDGINPVNNSKGCGGVMRIAPIPLFAGGKGGVTQKDNAGFCAEAAAITHGHPLGWMSAAALGNILYDIMQNFSLSWAVDDTIVFLEKEYAEYEDTPHLVELLEKAKGIAAMSGYSSTPNIMLEFDGNKELGEGWVGEEALAIAVCCALDGKGFAQNLQSAVGHNGDSDSTGSIAGQIMGAYWGEKAIPEAWLKNLELRDVIEEIADDLSKAVFMRKVPEYRNDEWLDKYLYAHK